MFLELAAPDNSCCLLIPTSRYFLISTYYPFLHIHVSRTHVYAIISFAPFLQIFLKKRGFMLAACGFLVVNYRLGIFFLYKLQVACTCKHKLPVIAVLVSQSSSQVVIYEVSKSSGMSTTYGAIPGGYNIMSS